MGLLAGTGNGYNPKGVTTRAEACAITNRLMGYMPRVNNFSKQPEQPTQPTQGQPGVYTALPDGSNVGESGVVYPAEGQIGPDGVVITRDPATGVLGYGPGQHGGIYLGCGKNGRNIAVNAAAPDSIKNMSGHYEKHGDYIYWTKEWDIIDGHINRKLTAEHPNVPAGTVADLHGNIIQGGTRDDKDAFFFMDSDGEWVGIYDEK